MPDIAGILEMVAPVIKMVEDFDEKLELINDKLTRLLGNQKVIHDAILKSSK